MPTAPAITSHNTFAAPETVNPAKFNGARLASDKIGQMQLTVPPPRKSVVVLAFE